MIPFDMPTLYRGDSIFPGGPIEEPMRDCCLNGLRARLSDGGTSELLRRFPQPVDRVLAHVGWESGSPEEQLARRSPLVSFTTSHDVADFFMRQKRQDLELESVSLHEARFFLSSLAVPRSALRPYRFGLKGWYEFPYILSYRNCRPHLAPWRIGRPLLIHWSDESLRAAESRQEQHFAFLINVVEFISGHWDSRPARTRDIALERATRDQEWLLYPFDEMPETPSEPSTFFHPNDYLSVAGFRSRLG